MNAGITSQASSTLKAQLRGKAAIYAESHLFLQTSIPPLPRPPEAEDDRDYPEGEHPGQQQLFLYLVYE